MNQEREGEKVNRPCGHNSFEPKCVTCCEYELGPDLVPRVAAVEASLRSLGDVFAEFIESVRWLDVEFADEEEQAEAEGMLKRANEAVAASRDVLAKGTR